VRIILEYDNHSERKKEFFKAFDKRIDPQHIRFSSHRIAKQQPDQLFAQCHRAVKKPGMILQKENLPGFFRVRKCPK